MPFIPGKRNIAPSTTSLPERCPKWLGLAVRSLLSDVMYLLDRVVGHTDDLGENGKVAFRKELHKPVTIKRE
jgi:hypothetical protein